MRRNVLSALEPATETNRGLWLDKFMGRDHAGGRETAKGTLVEETVSKISEPRIYKDFFHRYKQALREEGADFRDAATITRIIVGMGGESVLENSITLHKAYGVPYIPGSAIRGLASQFAARRIGGPWSRDLDPERYARGPAQTAVFGSPQTKGLITVYDALPHPGRWNFHHDVMTPHYQQYYAGGDSPPADWDSPVPLPFISASGKFLFALSAPDGAEQWLDAAWQLLSLALNDGGIGAKTNVGYGRMELESIDRHNIESHQQPSPRFISVMQRMENLRFHEFAGQGGQLTGDICSLDGPERYRAALALLDHVKDNRRVKRTSWYQKLLALANKKTDRESASNCD